MFYRKILILILSVLRVCADDNNKGVSGNDMEETDYYDLVTIGSLKSIEHLDMLGISDDILRLFDNSIEKIEIVKDRGGVCGTFSAKISLFSFLELYNVFLEQITDDVVFVIKELEKEFVYMLNEEFTVASEKEILIQCNELFSKIDEKSVKYLQKKFNLESFEEKENQMKIDMSSIYDFLSSSFKDARNLDVLKKEVSQKNRDKKKLKKILSAFYVKYNKTIPICEGEEKKCSSKWEVCVNFKDLIVNFPTMYKKDLEHLQMILLVEEKDLEILKSYEKLNLEYKQLYEEEQELIKLKNNALKSNYVREIEAYLDKYFVFIEKKKKFFNNVLLHKILTGDIAYNLIEKHKNEQAL